MDAIEVFKNKLNQIINESNLPASILKMILENTLYQIEIISLKQSIMNDEINKKEDTQ